MTRCENCGKKPRNAQSRSHSNVATKRRQMVNLQTKTVNGKRLTLCANCIKTVQKNLQKKTDLKIEI